MPIVNPLATTGPRAVAVALAAREMTWRDLSEQLGWREGILSDWRNGRRKDTLRMMQALVQALPELEYDIERGLVFRPMTGATHDE